MTLLPLAPFLAAALVCLAVTVSVDRAPATADQAAPTSLHGVSTPTGRQNCFADGRSDAATLIDRRGSGRLAGAALSHAAVALTLL